MSEGICLKPLYSWTESNSRDTGLLARRELEVRGELCEFEVMGPNEKRPGAKTASEEVVSLRKNQGTSIYDLR